MKKTILFTLLLYGSVAHAKNYYISSSGNDANTGATAASAWATITKLNASLASINAGDSILFRRGDIFYGSITMVKSATIGLPIVISAYGTGAKPIITGFTNATGWTNNSAGVWTSNVAAAGTNLIVVTINGRLQQIGRYPNLDATNRGYLTYTALSSAAPSITGPELSSTRNWTGAEVVIRKNHWILDRCRVTSHTAGVVAYTNPSGYTGKTGGYGYFFQDDIRTLDQQGEWFLNKTTKDLSVYFGTNTPTSYNIKVSTIDRLINFSYYSNYVVSNLSFEGANVDAIYINWGQNVKVMDCSFNNNYNAITASVLNGVVQGNSVTNTLNNGINIGDLGGTNGGTTVITNNYVKNVGLIPGMSGNGDAMVNGIRQLGSNATIQFNRVDSTGYQGIVFEGSNTSVKNNFITNFCSAKDDGAGIYTGSTAGVTIRTNITVSNNIILNGIGALNGTPNFAVPGSTYDAHGIYLDENTNGVTVTNNTVSNTPQGSGTFINIGFNLDIRHNTFHNVRVGLRIDRMPNKPIVRSVSFASNVVYPTVSNLRYWNGSLNYPVSTDIQSDVRAMFTRVDSNYYRSGITLPFDYFYHLTSGGVYVGPPALSLAGWKSFVNSESKSTSMSATVAPVLEYNTTNASQTVTLDAKYLSADGVLYNGTITLSPYSSRLLFKSGPIDPPLNVDAGLNVSVVFPIDSTVLKGVANIPTVTYQWTKKSGPAQFLIKSPTSSQTVVDSLAEGRYTFEVKATDLLGRVAVDTVVVTSLRGILPVKLVEFTATKNSDNSNLVKWTAASELFNSHYEIERSSNSVEFKKIGTLTSRNNADIQSRYSLIDNTPLQGNNYYRLKMVDLDGSYKYSAIALVARKGIPSIVVENILLSTTSGNVKMNLYSSEPVLVNYTIVSSAGEQISTRNVSLKQGSTTITDPVNGVRNALYFIKITSKNYTNTLTILAGQ